jgi:nitrous oxide reductase
MDKRDEHGQPSRRQFLKSMALTGGGVAVAATMGQAAAAPEVEAQQATDTLEGYHETQHIRDYYARAQF